MVARGHRLGASRNFVWLPLRFAIQSDPVIFPVRAGVRVGFAKAALEWEESNDSLSYGSCKVVVLLLVVWSLQR